MENERSPERRNAGGSRWVHGYRVVLESEKNDIDSDPKVRTLKNGCSVCLILPAYGLHTLDLLFTDDCQAQKEQNAGTEIPACLDTRPARVIPSPRRPFQEHQEPRAPFPWHVYSSACLSRRRIDWMPSLLVWSFEPQPHRAE